jgi:membrane protein DedA with SNARE-associated domain
MRARDFLFFAFISCLVWSIIIGYVGYGFGASLEVLIGHVRHYEKLIVVVIIALGITIWLIRRFIYNRKVTAKE